MTHSHLCSAQAHAQSKAWPDALLITNHCKSYYRQPGKCMTQLSARCFQSKLLTPDSILPVWLWHMLKVSLPEAVMKRQQEPRMCWPGWALEGHSLLSRLWVKVLHRTAATATAEHAIRQGCQCTLLSAHCYFQPGTQVNAGLIKVFPGYCCPVLCHTVLCCAADAHCPYAFYLTSTATVQIA